MIIPINMKNTYNPVEEKAKTMSQQIKKYKWPGSLVMRKMRIKTSSHWTLYNTISKSLN